MKRIICWALCLSAISVGLVAPQATAASIAQTKCTTAGAVKVIKSVRYVCRLSKSKLIWLQQAKPVTTPAPTISEILPSTNAEPCKLQYPSAFQTGFGFPRSSTRLPNSGIIKAIMLFVDFPDAKADDKPSEVAPKYSENFIKFYDAMSYGKVNFQVDVAPNYFHIQNSTSSYQMNLAKGQNGSGVNNYFQDALAAADPTVDFSTYDVVYVIPSRTNIEITYGPSFPMPPTSDLLRTNEKIFKSGAVAGADSRLEVNSLEWVWMAHETGHLFGLEHPWLVESDAQGRTTTGDTITIWDLMMAMWKNMNSFEFLSWTRFLLGWIPDSQMVCIDAQAEKGKTFEAVVQPIERQANGHKFMFVKTSTTKGIAIEVRRNEGFDHVTSQQEGTLVYEVDVSKGSNKGMATWLGSSKLRFQNIPVATLKTNDVVDTTFAKITILSQGSAGDRIKVEVH